MPILRADHIPEERIKALRERYPETLDKLSAEPERLSEAVSHQSAAIVSTIKSQGDYDRIKDLAGHEGMASVADWIAYCSLSQALANANAVDQIFKETH